MTTIIGGNNTDRPNHTETWRIITHHSDQRQPSRIWCHCGHSADDHLDRIDSQDENEILESICLGIDGKISHKMLPTSTDTTIELMVTCPCTKFNLINP